MYICGLEIEDNSCPYLCDDRIHCNADPKSPCGFIKGKEVIFPDNTIKPSERKEKWFEKYWK